MGTKRPRASEGQNLLGRLRKENVQLARLILETQHYLHPFAPRYFDLDKGRHEISPHPNPRLDADTLLIRNEIMARVHNSTLALPPAYPAAPTRPSKYGFYCTHEESGRFAFHNFYSLYAAKHFLDLVAPEFTWVAPDTILTPTGLKIRAERYFSLERVVEHDFTALEREWVIPEPYRTQYLKLLDTSPVEAPPEPQRAPKSSQPSTSSMIPLADIASELSIDPREARKILRTTNTPKPDHGWAFTPEQIPHIKEILTKHKKSR